MWYYSIENQQVGPVEEDAISALVAEQKINAFHVGLDARNVHLAARQSTALAKYLPQAALHRCGCSIQPPCLWRFL